MTSKEKVERLVDAFLEERGPSFAAMVKPLLGQFMPPLPEDPADLDRKLEQMAQLMLTLRSDGQEPALVTIGGQPLALPEAA